MEQLGLSNCSPTLHACRENPSTSQPRQARPPEVLWTVVLENIKLVYKIARQYAKRPQDFEDLVQEGLIGLFEGARRFDANHSSGASFGTYVYGWIQGYILTYYYPRHEEIPDQLTEEIEQTLLSDSEQDFVRRELRADIVRHLRKLDETERLVIALRWLPVEPMTMAALGKQLGITHERVRQIEAKAFAKLRAMMEGKK